jgi:hypothetical protein
MAGGARLPVCRRGELSMQTLPESEIGSQKPWTRASLVQGLPLAIAVVVLAASYPAQSAPNRCSQLKPLAVDVRGEDELVQEEHLPHLDPHWCRHARAVTNAMSRMIEIIESNPSHCNVSNDKFEALQTSNHRVIQLAEGCP